MQYLMNYSFMVLNLFIYSFVFKEQKQTNSTTIKKYVLIANIIYILSIYIAWITGTSSTTYVEGIGIKGWFESGNSICSIFILSLFIILTMLKDKNISKIIVKIIVVSTIVLIGIFLSTLVGTRVGLFGFAVVLAVYAGTEIFFAFKNKININKKLMIAITCIAVVIIGVVAVYGSNTLQRRAYLKSLDSGIIDEKTGEPSHVTGDVLKFEREIEEGTLSKDFLPEPNQEAIKALYEYANEHELALTDSRMQQLVYNIYLVKYQNDIGLMLFGNGYQANYGELTLEMEIPAFLLNFGIIGFLLYFAPFAGVLIYAAYKGIKNIKRIDAEYVIYFIGLGFSFILSLFAGYTFFNASTMIIITILCTLLINKCREFN